MTSGGYGIGTAFVSTIYGLGLANLVLLPLANRIRARVAAAFEIQEVIIDVVMAVLDRAHPSLKRQRLNSFLRVAAGRHGVMLGSTDRPDLNSRLFPMIHGS